MEKLYELLENCCPMIDFHSETKLVTDKIIDSLDLISIISDIEAEFDVSIDMEQIEPVHFDSAEAMWKLIQSLK